MGKEGAFGTLEEGEDYFNGEIMYNEPAAAGGQKRLTVCAKVIIALLFVLLILIVVLGFIILLPNPESDDDDDFVNPEQVGFILISIPDRATVTAAWDDLGYHNDALSSAIYLASQFESNSLSQCTINDVGELQNDCSLMTSKRRRGAVANVVQLENYPAAYVAASVMNNIKHSFLTGADALDMVGIVSKNDPTVYTNGSCNAEMDMWVADGCLPNYFEDPSYGCQPLDTRQPPGQGNRQVNYAEDEYEGFGAIVMDGNGNFSCSSFSRGVMHQIHGRIGPAAVLGAGCYASPAGAAIAIGNGEVLLQTMPTLRAVTLLEAGHTAEWAAKEAVRAMLRVDPDADGAIFVFRKNKTYFAASCFHENHASPEYIVQTGENKTKIETAVGVKL